MARPRELRGTWAYRDEAWWHRLTDAAGTEVATLGPVHGDRDGRAWLELPTGLVAGMVGGLEGWRVRWRVSGLTDDHELLLSDDLKAPRMIATRIVDRTDADRWIECRGAVVLHQPAIDGELEAVHARIHRGEHRGRRPGGGLTRDGVVQLIREYERDHGGRAPRERDLAPVSNWSQSRIEAVATSDGSTFAKLLERAHELGPLPLSVSGGLSRD